MAYGLEVRDAGSNVVFSQNSLSATIKDVIQVAAGEAGSRAYPDLTGVTISVNRISNTTVFDYRAGNGVAAQIRANVTVSYPGGVPTVAWSFAQTLSSDVYVPTTILVFAK